MASVPWERSFKGNESSSIRAAVCLAVGQCFLAARARLAPGDDRLRGAVLVPLVGFAGAVQGVVPLQSG